MTRITNVLCLCILVAMLLPIPAIADVYLVSDHLTKIQTSDPQNCKEAITEDERNACFTVNAAVYGDARLCDFVVNRTDEQASCYQLLAVHTQNATYCENAGIYEAYCNTEVQALATNNPSLCDALGNPGKCYEFINTYGDWNRCNKEFTPFCYIAAGAKPATGICRSIPEGEDNSACYALVATVQEKPALCEKASSPPDCYMLVAKALQLPSTCEKADLPYKEEDCKRTILENQVKSTGNATICDDPIWREDKESCLADVAVFQGNESICEGLGISEYCVQWVKSREEALKLDVPTNPVSEDAPHKWMGYLYIALAVVLAVGIALLLIRKRHK